MTLNRPSIEMYLDEREGPGWLLLDGGLATELEGKGFSLDTPLWSAEILRTCPEAIRDVHLDYLRAGARCISTASYQASIPGLLASGYSRSEANDLIGLSISLANEACDLFMSEVGEASCLHPLVAGSVGPYGAFLADGSEYRGNYGISQEALRDFHSDRFAILSAEGSTGVDLLAIETIPDFEEAEVLRDLLATSPHISAWVSFCCNDRTRICDGTPIRECASLFCECDQVIAIGVNCTAPQYVSSLIGEVRAGAPYKQVVVYPNSGEEYDGRKRQWVGTANATDFGQAARIWYEAGARLIGGCCRTGPGFIRSVGEAVQEMIDSG